MHIVVIDPNEKSREQWTLFFKDYLDLKLSFYDSEQGCIRDLKKTSVAANIVISNWSLELEKIAFQSGLRLNKSTRNTLLLNLNGPSDALWLRSVLDTYYRLGLTSDKLLPSQLLQLVQPLFYAQERLDHTVLIVDDDAIIREVIRGYLLPLGFQKIHECASVSEAIEFLNLTSVPIGLILSDWEMPKESGLALLTHVRNSKLLQSVPFIMVTSKTDDEPIKTLHAAEQGTTGYLLKPFTLKSFQSQLSRILEGFHQKQSALSQLVSARLLAAQGNTQLAESILMTAEHDHPKDSAILEALGDIYALRLQVQKGLTQAVEYYEQALKENPFHLGLYFKCFETLIAAGQTNNVIKLVQGYQNRSKSDDAFLVRLGKIYLRHQYTELAQKQFQAALKINPQNDEARAHLEQIQTSKITLNAA